MISEHDTAPPHYANVSALSRYLADAVEQLRKHSVQHVPAADKDGAVDHGAAASSPENAPVPVMDATDNGRGHRGVCDKSTELGSHNGTPVSCASDASGAGSCNLSRTESKDHDILHVHTEPHVKSEGSGAAAEARVRVAPPDALRDLPASKDGAQVPPLSLTDLEVRT